MKKALWVMGIIALLAVLLSQLGVQYMVHNALTELRAKYRSDASIEVEWVSADFEGTLSLHGFGITPFALKRTYQTEVLELHFSDYLSMLRDIPALASGDWTVLERLRTEGAQTELRGRAVDDWAAAQSHPLLRQMLGLYACSRADQIEDEAFYRTLGMGSLGMDIDLAVHLDHSAERLNLSFGLDLAERGHIDLYATLPERAIPRRIDEINMASLAFHSLQVTYVENGFFRRLSNYCTADKDWTREAYALLAAQQWQTTLEQSGLLVNDAVAAMYANYLGLGGKLSLSLQSERQIQPGQWRRFIDRDLVTLWGMQLRVNEASITDAEIKLLGEVLMPPAPQVVEADAEQKPEPVKSKGYVVIAVEELTEVSLGTKIRVEQLSGKLVEGRFQGFDEMHIKVSQNLKGGTVTFNVQRDELLEVAIWR